MSRQVIIETCISRENLDTLLGSLPPYTHYIVPPDDLLRLIKMKLNAVLTAYMRSPDPGTLSVAKARDTVVAIDRGVFEAALNVVGAWCTSRIEDLPIRSTSSMTLELVGFCSLRSPTRSEGPSLLSTPIDCIGLPALDGVSDKSPLLANDDTTVDNIPATDASLVNRSAAATNSKASSCTHPRTTEAKAASTEGATCFYFAEDDHPMHTITLPSKQWTQIQDLLAHLAVAINRVGKHRYELVWKSAERRVQISASGTFSLLFEQTANGMHRQLGFGRRNYKGKSCYLSEPLAPDGTVPSPANLPDEARRRRLLDNPFSLL